MIDAAKIATGDAWRVAGRTLQPLTLGHVVALDRLGVLTPKTREEFALALLIVMKPWREWLSTLNSSTFTTRFEWAKLLAKPVAMQELQGFLASNLALPKIAMKSQKAADGSLSGTPYLQHVRSILICRCNYDPKTVWDALYLQAMWDYFSYFEIEGVVLIVAPDAVDEIKRATKEFQPN